MNQRLREDHNFNDVPAAGATKADESAVGEFCDLVVIESELIDAVGAVEKRDAGGHWNPNSVLPPVQGQPFLAVATYQRHGDQQERVAAEWATKINDSI